MSLRRRRDLAPPADPADLASSGFAEKDRFPGGTLVPPSREIVDLISGLIAAKPRLAVGRCSFMGQRHNVQVGHEVPHVCSALHSAPLHSPQGSSWEGGCWIHAEGTQKVWLAARQSGPICSPRVRFNFTSRTQACIVAVAPGSNGTTPWGPGRPPICLPSRSLIMRWVA